MTGRARHAQVLRAALLGLLALCMTLQPVLAAVGEFHEAFSHAEQAALHLDAGTDHHDTLDPEGDEPTDTLHVVLHFAHCCGHSASLAPPEAAGQWLPAHEPKPLTVVAAPTLPPRLDSLLRPPILT